MATVAKTIVAIKVNCHLAGVTKTSPLTRTVLLSQRLTNGGFISCLLNGGGVRVVLPSTIATQRTYISQVKHNYTQYA